MISASSSQPAATGLKPAEAVAELQRLYAQSVAALRAALAAFLRHGVRPDAAARQAGLFAYPELRIVWSGDAPALPQRRAYGRLVSPGAYATTVTRPDLFAAYILDSLGVLAHDYPSLRIEVGPSKQEIPFPFVLDGAELDWRGVSAADLSRLFPSTDLAYLTDDIADGRHEQKPDADHPLALFDALRVDYSLARLKHYTGAPVEHVQNYILFTNYHRYVDAFVRESLKTLRQGGGRYEALSCAGGVVLDPDTSHEAVEAVISDGRRYQMPAYHLTAADRSGVTLINIGVGPSNAKTITDHLAVLRPHVWLMIGHCGGLRESQVIGDYVLAHAYLRDDHVLDELLPPEIPVPAIAEVQLALQRAASEISGEDREDLGRRLRTGTVVTTDDRDWELRFADQARRLSQSRAIAIDMESATLAAQGYRFRVPYGALLCVSDKPLHGELKLPGQANRFYEQAIAQHLLIGLRTVEILWEDPASLHSRKLRAFDEPPFR